MTGLSGTRRALFTLRCQGFCEKPFIPLGRLDFTWEEPTWSLMSDRCRTPFTEMGIQDKREPSIRDLSAARTGHGGATYLLQARAENDET